MNKHHRRCPGCGHFWGIQEMESQSCDECGWMENGPADKALAVLREGLNSRPNPPRIEPTSQGDNQDPATVDRLNGNGVDRQNGPNDTRGVQLGMRETGTRENRYE